MKKLLFIITLLLSFSAFCGNYVSLAEIQNNAITTVFTNMAKCQKVKNDTCISIPFGYNKNYHSVELEYINDYDSPNYSKSNAVSCEDEDACQTALEAQVCETGYPVKNLDSMEVYCATLTGYEQKLSGRKIVVVDEEKKAEYEVAEAKKEALRKSIDRRVKMIDSGKRVIAYVAGLNEASGLSSDQSTAIMTSFSDIVADLETGSLVKAKEKITAIKITEESLVSEDFKTAVLTVLNAEIAKYEYDN